MNGWVDITPSAKITVPPIMEYVEAKQAAIDSERLTYVNALPPEVKARFEIVEQCVTLLKDARIPFSLTVRPEPRHPDLTRRSIWQHQHLQYGDPFTNQEDYTECRDTMYQMVCRAAELFAKPLGMMVAICGMDGSIYHVANKPDNPPVSPPAE